MTTAAFLLMDQAIAPVGADTWLLVDVVKGDEFPLDYKLTYDRLVAWLDRQQEDLLHFEQRDNFSIDKTSRSLLRRARRWVVGAMWTESLDSADWAAVCRAAPRGRVRLLHGTWGKILQANRKELRRLWEVVERWETWDMYILREDGWEVMEGTLYEAEVGEAFVQDLDFVLNR